MNIQKIGKVVFALAVFAFLVKFAPNRYVNFHRYDHYVVGTSADYQPYAFIDTKTGEIVGFDVDVVREVVKRLNKKIKIKDIPFTSLIFDLLAQEVDIVAAGMSPTDRRARAVSFSDTYLDADALVVLTKQDGLQVTKLEDLYGKKVVVNTGYTADLYLSHHKEIELVKLKNPSESFMALQSGSVDAFVSAQSSLIPFLEKKGAVDQYVQFVLPDTGESYALVVSKHQPELLKKINQALRVMQQDGTLTTLKQKWKLG